MSSVGGHQATALNTGSTQAVPYVRYHAVSLARTGMMEWQPQSHIPFGLISWPSGSKPFHQKAPSSCCGVKC